MDGEQGFLCDDFVADAQAGSSFYGMPVQRVFHAGDADHDGLIQRKQREIVSFFLYASGLQCADFVVHIGDTYGYALLCQGNQQAHIGQCVVQSGACGTDHANAVRPFFYQQLYGQCHIGVVFFRRMPHNLYPSGVHPGQITGVYGVHIAQQNIRIQICP